MREMKDSGIEWIGDIPKNWIVMPIKYYFSVGRGRVISVNDLHDDGKYPVYSSQTENNGCFGYLRTYDFSGPAITWTTDGAKAGTVFFRDGKYNCTNVCGILKIKNQYKQTSDLHFLTYAISVVAFANKRYDINGFKIMNNEMANIRYAIPPYEEQQKIATFLDKKCTKIDALTKDIEKQIENLQQYKKSVITEAVTKGLDPNVEMKDSGVDWCDSIPKTWDVRKIKSLVSAMTDGTHASFQRVDNGQYLLSAKNVFEDGLHISDNESMISDYDYKAITANGFPKKNDILMCCVGTIGRCTKYEYDYPIAFQRSVIFLRTNEEILPDMLKYCLMSSYTLQQETLNVNQTAQAGLYQGSVGNLKITIPSSIKEQKEIIKFLDQKCSDIDSIIESKQQQLTTLADYKKSLIFEYVTGKKEV